ncbi:MAG: hypothetical protein J3Q66DRAFT_359633 [Benniella sp.]|nr:MAG: hypothetical protein J3Q66DRAFT_359633 [Benniella sp.]
MFGYISRHCPRLKDVLITRSMLNLTLDGGLCLMTRLRDLERLKIVSHSKQFRLDAADVNWIGHPQLDTITAKSSGLFIKAKSIAPAPIMRVIRSGVTRIFELDDEWHSSQHRGFMPKRRHPSDEALRNSKPWRRQHGKWHSAMTSSGTKTLVIPLKDPSESAYPCWPHLRSFVLGVDPVHLFKNVENANLIQSLRPDINFKVQQWG